MKREKRNLLQLKKKKKKKKLSDWTREKSWKIYTGEL